MKAKAKARLLRWSGLVIAITTFVALGAASPASGSLGVFDYFPKEDGASGAGGRLSDEPAGIAARDVSGDVYVVDSGNDRVQQFTEDGDFIRAFGADVVSPGAPNNSDEVQSVRVDATEGQFTLSYDGEATGDIDFDAGPAEVQAELNALGTIGAGGGSVSVTGGPGDVGATSPYLVSFDGGPLAGVNAEPLGAASGTEPLAGGGATATVATTNPGATGFEVCDTTAPNPNVPSDCKAGAGDVPTGGGMSAPRGIAINQTTGDLYVVDQEFARLDQFSATGAWLRSWGQDVVASGPGDDGTGPEICEAVDVCKSAPTSFTGLDRTGGAFQSTNNNLFNAHPAVAPAGAPNAGNVIVPDPANSRIQEFTPDGNFVRTFGFDVEAGGANGFEICAVAVDCKNGSGISNPTEPGQFGPRNPQRVAIDGAGTIYAVEAVTNGSGEAFRVHKFTPQAGPPTLTPTIFAPELLSGTTESNGPTGLAVDASTGHVLVAKYFEADQGDPPAISPETRLLELDSSGVLLDTHMVGAGINPPASVTLLSAYAIRAGSDSIYLTSTTGAPRGYRLGEVPPPSAELTEVSEVTADSAVVRGIVNPNGGPLDTSFRIEFSTDGSSWTALTEETNVGHGEAGVPIEEAVDGLPPNKTVLLRIVAGKPLNSATAFSAPVEIETLGSTPAVETGIAWWNGEAGLALSGIVNPGNSNTTYYFEYGPTEDYGASAPVNLRGPAGDDGGDRRVVQQLYDLDTDTPFHYRLVAVNQFGTTVGADRVVAPHEQSYVYELISTGESNGLGVNRVQAVSDDGRRVVLFAQTLGDPPSLPGQINYFPARLGPGGWTVPGFGPDPAGGSTTAVGGSNAFSADLTAMVIPQRTTQEGKSQEGRFAMSRNDGTSEPASPRLVPVAYTGKLSENQGNQFLLQAGSANLSTIVFKKGYDGPAIAYLPGEPLVVKGYVKPITVNIYQSTGLGSSAMLSLVNRDPSGAPIANVCGAWVGTLGLDAGHSARPVSRDGSVVYFSARPTAPTTGNCPSFGAPPLRLYKRIDGSNTVEVSKSQCDREAPEPSCSSKNTDDVFQGGSSDGSVAFFTSGRQLTDSDLDEPGSFGGCGNSFSPGGCDLYLYDADPVTGQPELVQVSAGEETGGHPTVGSGADVLGVVEGSTDGSRIYFVAKGQLTEEATQGANNLFVYERSEEHPHGRIDFVTALAPAAFGGDTGLWSEGGSREAYALPFNGPDGPGEGDGHLLVFASLEQLVPDDEDSALDLYRYDDEAGELTCASCEGDEEIDVQVPKSILGVGPDRLQRGRVAAEDGKEAVFSTDEAILPSDGNAATDVYVWREGEGLGLVTGGTDQAGVSSSPPLISADGERVFFATKVALHPSDENSAVDAYAATLGGGLPLPRPEESECEDGQACRGEAPEPPAAEAPESEDFRGEGNVSREPVARNPCAPRARRARAFSRRAKALRRRATTLSNRLVRRRYVKRTRRFARAARRNARVARQCRRRVSGEVGPRRAGGRNRPANANQGGSR